MKADMDNRQQPQNWGFGGRNMEQAEARHKSEGFQAYEKQGKNAMAAVGTPSEKLIKDKAQEKGKNTQGFALAIKTALHTMTMLGSVNQDLNMESRESIKPNKSRSILELSLGIATGFWPSVTIDKDNSTE